MTDYRYIYHKLGTEEVIAEIPLFGTYMDLELNKGGRCDGSFSLDMTGYDNQTLIDATIPGETGIVVERNGNPIWSGFTWSRVYQSQAKSVQMYHQSWENLPQYQLNLDDLSYVTTEQIAIFYDLWTRMQAVTGRNFNINVPTGPYPVITPKDAAVLASDFNYYGEIISSIADADDGFDWTIDVAKTGNQYVRTLRTGFPQLGSSDPTQLAFEYPGAILNYYATESMSGAGTNVFMLGAGSGSSMLTSENRQDLMIAQGFPRWDTTVNRKDVTDLGLLQSLGAQAGAIRKPPMLVMKPELKSDRLPEFGSFGLGDAGLLHIKDPRFPNGFDFQCRVAKWMLQPQSATNVDYYNIIMVGDDQSG